MENNNSFFDFEKTSKSEWLEVIEKDLKGKPLEMLNKSLEEGVDVNAVYTKDDLPDYHFEIAKEKSGWNYAESFSKTATNAEVLEALARGINEINIPYSSNLTKQIQGVETAFIHLNIFIENQDDLEQLKADELIPTLHNLTVINDPLNRALKTGEKIDLSNYGNWNLNSGICVDILHLQNAGASAKQQMAAFLGTLSQYVEIVGAEKLANTFLRIGVSKNYFLEIAKLRALRLTFSTFCQAHDTTGKLYIVAETSLSDFARLDAKTNILRSTTQAMSAIVGGADAVSISNFDALLGNSSELSKRVARNIHHLLKEESHLDAVDDPSKGSYYLENLTDNLAQIGWQKFVAIENNGGYANALKQGWFQNEVFAVASQTQHAYDSGSKTIIGANKYPNNLEHAPELNNYEEEEGITPTIALPFINFAASIETAKSQSNE